MNIYYNDGVQPTTCVSRCRTIEEAKSWVNKQLKGYTMVDDNHPCSVDVIASSKTAEYLVFDGELFAIGEDGEPCIAKPIYETGYFYTE